MNVVVREADSAEEFLESWKKFMRDMPWYKERRLFDYHPEEIVEDIKLAWQKPNNIFLVAKPVPKQETTGVLGVTVANQVGTVGRWEPAVAPKHSDSGVGEAMLEEAFSRLRKSRVPKVRCILKFPFGKLKRASWHLRLFQKGGFVKERPSGVLLLADLCRVSTNLPATTNVQIVDGSDFSLEDFADFTQRAYLSTPRDRAVHQSDPYISNRENVLKVLKAVKAGRMGVSPPECWLVAKLKDQAAGFIIAFMPPKSRYRPPHGVIGELGVFPEFRRKGIAKSLTANIFSCFRKHGCSYSLVGTPQTNTSALKLYGKMGFTPAFEQMDLQKIL